MQIKMDKNWFVSTLNIRSRCTVEVVKALCWSRVGDFGVYCTDVLKQYTQLHLWLEVFAAPLQAQELPVKRQ